MRINEYLGGYVVPEQNYQNALLIICIRLILKKRSKKKHTIIDSIAF